MEPAARQRQRQRRCEPVGGDRGEGVLQEVGVEDAARNHDQRCGAHRHTPRHPRQPARPKQTVLAGAGGKRTGGGRKAERGRAGSALFLIAIPLPARRRP